MSAIFGLANLAAADYQYVNTAGEEVIYTATQEYTRMFTEQIARVESVFIGGMTENHNERFKLPGTGRMSRRVTGVRGPAVKAYGGWDVGFPLYDFEEAVVADDVKFAYMTPQEYQNAVDTILNRYTEERRWHLFHALLDDQAGSSETFSDPEWGDITVAPLANGDATVYPPVLGSTTEAQDDHYAGTNYTTAQISDTNNPLPTLRDELVEHFGTSTGGEDVVVFCNNAESPYLEDLTDFDPVVDMNIRAGDNRDVPINLPNVPGKILGRSNGVWVVEWRYIPAQYLVGIHLDAPPPCVERVDPAATGLPRGLNLVAVDEDHPLQSAIYRARFGIGVRNRLNGAVLYTVASTSYTIPAAYT